MSGTELLKLDRLSSYGLLLVLAYILVFRRPWSSADYARSILLPSAPRFKSVLCHNLLSVSLPKATIHCAIDQ
jgi:hypothetical protein